MAEMFHSRHIPVSMLVREANYWDMVLPPEESKMVGRHIVKHGIDLRLKTELKEIVGNDLGLATGVVTNQGDHIDCEFVGLTAGVHPNIRWLKGSDLECDRGILVNEYLQTNINDVYAIGDCVQLRDPRVGRRDIEAVWYTGRMMGEVVAHNLCSSQVAYDPGIWFNSAKFFDIEYQVYGQVPVQPSAQLQTIYWEDEDGEKSIRLVFEKDSEKITGFNLMGVRFRHEVCEKWISEETPVEKVLEDLALASFDPEFFPSYHDEVVRSYNDKFGKKIPIHRKRKYDLIFDFLNK
jgi:NAD(P)H-nitrite reductase large subunit